jgi:PPOX class probable F420-dependent enzyme
MNAEEREAFLWEPRNAVLATTTPDGLIQAAPVWFIYADGAFRIITERGSARHRNVERSGRAALCVDNGRFSYVSAEGPVSVQDTVSYEERLALHTRYRGPEAARQIVDRGGHERMVMLLLRPERWFSRARD